MKKSKWVEIFGYLVFSVTMFWLYFFFIMERVQGLLGIGALYGCICCICSMFILKEKNKPTGLFCASLPFIFIFLPSTDWQIQLTSAFLAAYILGCLFIGITNVAMDELKKERINLRG